jgi:hypothetical protein
MATVTPKLGLIKPAGGETLDVSIVNSNMDDIDAASGAYVCTSTTRPSGGNRYLGQFIYETDTGRILMWDNTGTWRTMPYRYGNAGAFAPSITGVRSTDYELARIAIPQKVYGRMVNVITANYVTASGGAATWHTQLGWDPAIGGLPLANDPANSIGSIIASGASGAYMPFVLAGNFYLPANTDCSVRAVMRATSGSISQGDAYGAVMSITTAEVGARDDSDWAVSYN